MTKKNLIRQLPANPNGKDYVIGDLHGCFDLLETLLQAAKFDPLVDRLFSVGDLIDRGNHSLRCLELLFEPWFYAVQGNHELMMLDFFEPYIRDGQLERIDDLVDNGFLEYGGQWVREYFSSDKRCMTDAFNRCLPEIFHLPLMYLVGEADNRFHVIHAELTRPDHRNAPTMVWLDRDIDNWFAQQAIPQEIKDRLYWSRTLMMSDRTLQQNRKQDGLSKTFCGHTPGQLPRCLLSHINIDTGAFIGVKEKVASYGYYSLTLFDIHASEWSAASYQYSGIKYGAMPFSG